MRPVLELLRDAPAAVLPDPKVAAIVYAADGTVIASYNKTRFGEPHSEAAAVARAFGKIIRLGKERMPRTRVAKAEQHLASLRGRLATPRSFRSNTDLTDVWALVGLLDQPFRSATLAVNLEPCSHFGKNPACAAVIAAAGFGKVLFSHYDPDPDVCGKGERMLLDSGVAVEHGVLHREALAENHLFCKVAFYLPKLFEGVHPTVVASKRPPITMLSLYVPEAEVKTRDLGKTVAVDTFDIAPRRHTTEPLRAAGTPRVSVRAFRCLPKDPEAVLFTTLLNPVAIIESISKKFGIVPGTIVSATPDMGFQLGKEECIGILRGYCPDVHVCVGVRMASLRDKLARISLRRRLDVERARAGMVAVLVLAKGVVDDKKERVETRIMDLVGATTVHVSRLEEYLLMLRFLRSDVDATVYMGGDLLSGRWRSVTVTNIAKMVERVPRVRVCCTEGDVVRLLKASGVPRVSYLEPYWEIVP